MIFGRNRVYTSVLRLSNELTVEQSIRAGKLNARGREDFLQGIES